MRLFKSVLLIATSLAAGAPAAWGFALGGPLTGEPWQTPVIGYQLPGDITTPRNLGEEYRRNSPVVYYYFDANFRDYFGSNGVYAIEQAIAVFNNISNVSQYSLNLTEVPTQAQRENYRAEALSLMDMKSLMMTILCEQMGLVSPERYVWTLHDREHFGNVTCPAGQAYEVVQRSFDPIPSPLNQFQNSSYVNGTLYSYTIAEFCDAPGTPPNAFTVPFPVDPLDFGFTSIAGAVDNTAISISGGIIRGRFFTGLTRDDVGGLRYLLRTNNLNFEGGGSNTVSYVTNNSPQLLVTSNLTLLAQQSLTNNAATLAGLYPGLAILNSTPIFTNIYTTNFSAYFTNSPTAPYGSAPQLKFTTNVTVTVATYYQQTFGNLFTIKYTPQGWNLYPLYTIPAPIGGVPVSVLTESVGFTSSPYFPVGSTNSIGTNVVVLSTNSTFQTYTTNDYSGDFVILPPNLCSVQILFSQLTNVIPSTNVIVTAFNNPIFTNTSGGLISYTQSLVSYFTNHVFVVNPVLCTTNALGWRQGIEKVRFVRIPDNGLDELNYALYNPITNNYNVTTFDPTNNVYVTQRNQRLVLFPDILITAQDLAGVPGNSILDGAIYGRNISFSPSTAYNLAYQGLAGPGTIETQPAAAQVGANALNAVIWNKSGPLYGNTWPDSATLQAEALQIPLIILGSFDGTTNAPVVYPNGTSIENIENLFLIQVLPQSLPLGNASVPYQTTTFSATGGTAPYTWTLAPGSSSLPPGLTLSSGGTISGVPTQDGTFDFVVRLADASGRVADYNYSITINL